MGQIFIPADNVASSLQLSPRYSVQLLLNYLWWSTGHLQKQSSYLYSVHFPSWNIWREISLQAKWAAAPIYAMPGELVGMFLFRKYFKIWHI